MINQSLINKVKATYLEEFEKESLLVFSPGRINLIGEHTDYNNGFVFPAAIDKGIVIAIGITNRDFCTAIASDTNEKITFSLNNLQKNTEGNWKNYLFGVINELQKKEQQLQSFDIVISGDIPIGSGLSSSAALENAIVFGLNELFELNLTKQEMILISQQAEHNFVGVKCGIMDQYASMFGQKNTALLLDCLSLDAKHYSLDLGEYTLLLINSKVKHSLADSAYNKRRSACERVANSCGKTSLREVSESDILSKKDKLIEDDINKALFILEENKRVLKASEAINKNNLTLLGDLLYQSHNGLSKDYQVSCKELDFLVDFTKENKSVLGARMMGGGFGGCTINIIKQNAVDDFRKTIEKAYLDKFQHKCEIYHVQLCDGTHKINI